MKQGTILLALLTLPSFVHAANEVEKRYTRVGDTVVTVPRPQQPGWTGSIALGAVVSSGNTETVNLSGDATAKLDNRHWRHKLEASALMAESENTKTAERYLLGYKADYKVSRRSYLFGALRAEFDQFSGYDQQLSATVGYGYRLLDSGTDTLDLEVGVGMRKNKLDTGDTESETVGRLAGDYVHRFSETAEFRQGLLLLSGENNTSIDSISAIRASLIASVAMEAALKIKHNSDPVGNKKETDTITSLSLVYGF